MTGPQQRALAVIAAAADTDANGVRESNTTDPDRPCVSWQVARSLQRRGLARSFHVPGRPAAETWWTITDLGRHEQRRIARAS